MISGIWAVTAVRPLCVLKQRSRADGESVTIHSTVTANGGLQYQFLTVVFEPFSGGTVVGIYFSHSLPESGGMVHVCQVA